MLSSFRSYHGEHEAAVFDQQPCVRFTPDAGGRSRHATPEVYIPPLRVAGWVRLVEYDGEHTGNHDGRLDGFHLHLGHVGNNRNYALSLVMRMQESRILREYGWRGYDRLATGESPQLVDGGVYVFEVRWLPDRIEAKVANELSTHSLAAELKPEAGSPADSYAGAHVPVIPAGAIGLRFDNQVAEAALAVKEL